MKTLPEILLQDLEKVKGFQKEAFIAAHQQPAITSVRLHPHKGSYAFQFSEVVPWCSSGRYLPERPIFTLDPLYHAGAYYVQEASSMFLQQVLETVLPQRKGLRVLDLCAAPGGKSTLISSFIDAESLLISNEVIRSRASILGENMTRWGYMNTWVTSNDPRDFAKLTGYFDVIVVDAPCSGSGLFRKDIRALEDWTESNVVLCGQRQQRILADVWPALKMDGILIYATCSYSPQEDEEILDWLKTGLDVETISIPLQKTWGVQEVVTAKGMYGYRFSPDRVKGEGFFIAAVRKTATDEDELKPVRFKSSIDKKIQLQTSHLLNVDFLPLKNKDGNYTAIHPVHEADWHRLQGKLYFRKNGVQLGTPVAKDWLPHHDIAVSVDRSPSLTTIELAKEEALRFLKKEDFALPVENKGWFVLTYNGLGLGWVKALGNRFNNYLPKHWRIRMEIPDEDNE